jgi:hypothetical protein
VRKASLTAAVPTTVAAARVPNGTEEVLAVELPRSFLIRESSHRILNPFTSEKLAALGGALRLLPGVRLLDLACGKDELVPLPQLVETFGDLGWDLVEMVLADQDSWDRYVAAQWLNIRRWIDANPDDELMGEMRAELDAAPLRHVRYQREYVGRGGFALARR